MMPLPSIAHRFQWPGKPKIIVSGMSQSGSEVNKKCSVHS